MIKEATIVNILKEVKTLDGGVPVYKNARVSMEFSDPQALSPTSKYVLKENLRCVDSIRSAVYNQQGIDIFTYPDVVVHEGRRISPPVVEEIDGDDLIIDGLHRTYIARANGERIVVAHIADSLAGYEPIGAAVSWGEVKKVDEQPSSGPECRRLRFGLTDDPKELRKYYRDFSALGSSGRRPRRGQNG